MEASLSRFGWTLAHQTAWDALALDGLRPARVVADFGTSLKLATPEIMTAELSGKLAHYVSREDAPKVGDWVAVRLLDNSVTVESVVLRANEIARKGAGNRVTKQVFATNVDIAFVLLSLDNDFSVERLSRYLFQLSVYAIEVVIVLNKADATDDLQSYLDQLEGLDVPVVVVSALAESSADAIAAYIAPGKTAILLGSSGVGKSTLTNRLLGVEVQKTNAVRTSDMTGRHTTVHRELFVLPGGGILIDTPGVRELQLWGSDDELAANFDDIVRIAATCRYKNCHHDKERGCAVHKALANGTLSKAHYANYLRMKSEIKSLSARRTERQRRDNARRTEHGPGRNIGRRLLDEDL